MMPMNSSPEASIAGSKPGSLDYASVEEIYWNVPGDKIDPQKLPSRALDNAPAKDLLWPLIADYNQDQDLTPESGCAFWTD